VKFMVRETLFPKKIMYLLPVNNEGDQEKGGKKQYKTYARFKKKGRRNQIESWSASVG